jgi:hypothetical protein
MKEQNFGERKSRDNSEFYFKKRMMKPRKESRTYLRRRREYTVLEFLNNLWGLGT